MKLNNIRLIDLIPLREAEEEAADDNPFDAGGDKPAADSEEKEEDKDKATPAAKPALAIRFNRLAVKRYNDTNFKGNEGEVVNITKDGLTVKLPNETQIFVNFNDIL